MIDVQCNAGRCKMELSGTGAELSAETGTIIKGIYDALMKSCPAGAETTYGNMYRMCILKALTDCTPVDNDSSYPHDIINP